MMLSRLSSPRYVPARNQYPQTGKPQLFHKQFSCWAYCGSKIHLSSCTRSHCSLRPTGPGAHSLSMSDNRYYVKSGTRQVTPPATPAVLSENVATSPTG